MADNHYFQTERHCKVPSISAPFRTLEDAEAAARALHELGYTELQIDRGNPYPAARGDVSDQPFPVSLTGQPSTDQGPASAVDDSISGLSTDELVGETPYILTVVLGDNDYDRRERVLQVLRQHGAAVGIHQNADQDPIA